MPENDQSQERKPRYDVEKSIYLSELAKVTSINDKLSRLKSAKADQSEIDTYQKLADIVNARFFETYGLNQEPVDPYQTKKG